MNTIANTASSATSTVSNFFGSAFNRVGQFAGRIWTMISNIVPSAVSSRVAKLFAPVTTAFKGLPKPIKATVVLTAAGTAAFFAVKYFKSKECKQPAAASANASSVSEAQSQETSAQNPGVMAAVVLEDKAANHAPEQIVVVQEAERQDDASNSSQQPPQAASVHGSDSEE